jgi:hypothetical protein
MGPRMVYQGLGALQEAGIPLYTERVERANRWMFVDTFKFKVPPPFSLTRLHVPASLRGFCQGL